MAERVFKGKYPQPGLILFEHGDIAKSTDGTPYDPGNDIDLSKPTGLRRYKPDFNQLFACNCSHLLVALHPSGEDKAITALAYPGTPDMRWAVQPWRGKYLELQIGLYRTAGAGTVRVKAQIEGPAATKQDLEVFPSTDATATFYHGNYDISTVGGKDWRGDDGFLNLYFEVSAAATTGLLVGVAAHQHNVSGRVLW